MGDTALIKECKEECDRVFKALKAGEEDFINKSLDGFTMKSTKNEMNDAPQEERSPPAPLSDDEDDNILGSDSKLWDTALNKECKEECDRVFKALKAGEDLEDLKEFETFWRFEPEEESLKTDDEGKSTLEIADKRLADVPKNANTSESSGQSISSGSEMSASDEEEEE